jgi:N-acyl-D-aspartate/D-glutamate deacylase
MAYDLVFRGGRVVDGSGLPSYLADVAIKDGKIVDIGQIGQGTGRSIDVHGLVVAPGFIDHHTHMDGQIQWDPYATSEPQQGITSIVMGNCGLALAPVKKGDEDALVKNFVRVEAIPREALEQGVSWGWHSYGDYLDRLEGRIGVNVGGLVGHIPVRQYVLGEESVERQAKDSEIQRMQQLVRDAIEGGALGFSTNRNERHMREDGKPVASQQASDDEVYALCSVLGDLNAGIIQTNLGQYNVKHFEIYDRLARHTHRPIVGDPVLHRAVAPKRWMEQLDAVAPTIRDGYRVYLRSHTVPLYRHFTLKKTAAFDEFTTWKALMFLDLDARKAAFKNSQTRAQLRAELAEPRQTTFHKRWDFVEIEKVAKPENERFAGKNVAEFAAARGQDPLDAFLDLALEENLETVFRTANSGSDPNAMGEILRSPYVLVGSSDAGAHVQYGAQFGYGTTLLGLWVRERGVLSLEQAVSKLTFEVASLYGLNGRGLLRPGYAADLAVFDPKTISACDAEWAEDYPAGTKRLIQRAIGMHYVAVNGKLIYADNNLTGELPGHVLRSSAYRGRTATEAER